MPAPSLSVQELFALVRESPARARITLGADHVLVPLEPWVAAAPPVNITAPGAHVVATGAGRQVPVLGAACYPLALEAAMAVGRAGGAALVIDQPTVSRIHAEITWSRGAFSMVEKGSYNGTLLNQRVLQPGESIELRNGDVLIFGEAQLLFGDLDHLAKLIEVRRR